MYMLAAASGFPCLCTSAAHSTASHDHCLHSPAHLHWGPLEATHHSSTHTKQKPETLATGHNACTAAPAHHHINLLRCTPGALTTLPSHAPHGCMELQCCRQARRDVASLSGRRRSHRYSTPHIVLLAQANQVSMLTTQETCAARLYNLSLGASSVSRHTCKTSLHASLTASSSTAAVAMSSASAAVPHYMPGYV